MIEFYYYLLFVFGGPLPMKVNEIGCTKHLINTPHYHDVGFCFTLPNSTNFIMWFIRESVRFLGYWDDTTCITCETKCPCDVGAFHTRVWGPVTMKSTISYWGMMSRPSHFILRRSLNGWKLAWDPTRSPVDHGLLDFAWSPLQKGGSNTKLKDHTASTFYIPCWFIIAFNCVEKSTWIGW